MESIISEQCGSLRTCLILWKANTHASYCYLCFHKCKQRIVWAKRSCILKMKNLSGCWSKQPVLALPKLPRRQEFKEQLSWTWDARGWKVASGSKENINDTEFKKHCRAWVKFFKEKKYWGYWQLSEHLNSSKRLFTHYKAYTSPSIFHVSCLAKCPVLALLGWGIWQFLVRFSVTNCLKISFIACHAVQP